jgi:hypothetical protein
MQESTLTFLEAKAKLEALCAYQERCQFEIEQKLITWKFPEDQRNQLITDLITNKFILTYKTMTTVIIPLPTHHFVGLVNRCQPSPGKHHIVYLLL